ncbi:MAG: hypothetical protein N2490_07440 [Ignavibacteria bacterium]|nr:hypothetical protein [Ignavibacteria bacterium]
MLKKLTSVVLILLIIFNSFGYLLAYLQFKSYFKSLISEKRETSIPENELELIIIPKSEIGKIITFIDNNEFIYNNKLYDIFKVEETQNELLFLCLYDVDETRLDIAFSRIEELDSEKRTLLINILKSLNNIISVGLISSYTCNNSLPFSPFQFFQSIHPYNNYLDIPTPPPKTSL